MNNNRSRHFDKTNSRPSHEMLSVNLSQMTAVKNSGYAYRAMSKNKQSGLIAVP